MANKVLVICFSVLWAAFLSSAAIAQHGGHGHGESSTPSPGMPSHETGAKSGSSRSVTVEGYKISFEVMDMSAHMAMPGMKGHSQHGASGSSPGHSIMVTIQDTASKEIISDANVTYTILSPSEKKETGKLEWSGDHYGANFNPKEKGAYRVQVMIHSGGMEREAKFQYEAK